MHLGSLILKGVWTPRGRGALYLGDAERLAQILLLENRVEIVSAYPDIDHDPIEARSSHRYLPLSISVLPGGSRPAVSPNSYEVSNLYAASHYSASSERSFQGLFAIGNVIPKFAPSHRLRSTFLRFLQGLAYRSISGYTRRLGSAAPLGERMPLRHPSLYALLSRQIPSGGRLRRGPS